MTARMINSQTDGRNKTGILHTGILLHMHKEPNICIYIYTYIMHITETNWLKCVVKTLYLNLKNLEKKLVISFMGTPTPVNPGYVHYMSAPFLC